jgi:hypothetical protein
VRPGGDGSEQLDAVLVLETLGAPQRRLMGGRRGRSLEEAEPEPVPTSRATVVRPEPFGSADEASAWLREVRGGAERADEELGAALGVLNRALHAHRVATADPHARDVSVDQALVARIGIGSGEDASRGSFQEAWELPRERRRTKRSMEAPDERFAAILGGRERSLACEELVLRVRADLDAGRPREAALEARVALEALLAELPDAGELGGDREAVGAAANAALRGPLTPEAEAELEAVLGRMEHALKRRRLGA